MGSGKTSVGRRVADHLGWPFRDSDREIEAATGLSVRELGERDGIDAMHALEAQHVLDALADPAPSVIAAAAFTIEVAEVRGALLRPEIVPFWLRAEPHVLASRFTRGPHRPWYGDSPEAFLTVQAARRHPLFAAVDPIVIDVDRARPPAVAARAIEALASIGSR